jgi:hypothetical protein
MPSDLIRRAALNNARWCDAVCRAHGAAGDFRADMWLNRREVPRLYPNVVTLNEDVDEQLRGIEDLERALPSGWAVKDSFATLDLTALGFRVLFEAHWIVRSESAPLPDATLEGVRWATITTAHDLTRWERAWRAAPGNQIPEKDAAIFGPALLIEHEVVVIAAYQDGEIVAGFIANRSDGLVGFTNMFLPARKAGVFAAGCVAAISTAFPGMPIMAYAPKPAASRALGFEAIGPLRICSRAVDEVRR